jgi:hypothetical protein
MAAGRRRGVATDPGMSIAGWLDLGCHPASRADAVRAVQVLVCRSTDGVLRMTYRLSGDFSRIRLPPAGAPRFAMELWRHTCFEAFVAVEGKPAYHEFNFAPSGEWALYAFSGYRKSAPFSNETMGPDIAVRATDDRLEMDVVVRLALLSVAHARAALRVGLSAVIETDDGLSYWALRHPGERPDFHDARGFALMLEPPERG